MRLMRFICDLRKEHIWRASAWRFEGRHNRRHFERCALCSERRSFLT